MVIARHSGAARGTSRHSRHCSSASRSSQRDSLWHHRGPVLSWTLLEVLESRPSTSDPGIMFGRRAGTDVLSESSRWLRALFRETGRSMAAVGGGRDVVDTSTPIQQLIQQAIPSPRFQHFGPQTPLSPQAIRSHSQPFAATWGDSGVI